MPSGDNGRTIDMMLLQSDVNNDGVSAVADIDELRAASAAYVRGTKMLRARLARSVDKITSIKWPATPDSATAADFFKLADEEQKLFDTYMAAESAFRASHAMLYANQIKDEVAYFLRMTADTRTKFKVDETRNNGLYRIWRSFLRLHNTYYISSTAAGKTTETLQSSDDGRGAPYEKLAIDPAAFSVQAEAALKDAGFVKIRQELEAWTNITRRHHLYGVRRDGQRRQVSRAVHLRSVGASATAISAATFAPGTSGFFRRARCWRERPACPWHRTSSWNTSSSRRAS